MEQNRELMTNSRSKAGRACLRLEQIEYREGYRPIKDADALRLGTLIHLGLEAWWFLRFEPSRGRAALAQLAPDSRLRAVLLLFSLDMDGVTWSPLLAFAAAAERVKLEPGFDDFERAYVIELLRGYDARWLAEPYETIAVEIQFRTRLINPATGAPSTAWDLGGKIDVLVRHTESGEVYFVEHKSAGTDISVGSTYWKRLRMDSQVSTYYDGAASVGYDVHGCLYDVLYKPRAKPYKATPEEDRETTLPKYKACPECKRKGAEPAPHHVNMDADAWVKHAICGTAAEYVLPDGRTVAIPCEPGKVISEPPRYKSGVRIADETPAEYAERLSAAIAAEPASYYVREPVPRLEAALNEYRIDLWHLAASMRESANAGRFPRNPNACERWGRFCDYFDVCCNTASLDDPTRFKRLDHVHAELDPAPSAEA